MGKYTSMRKVYYILQAKREVVQKELDARLASESVIKTGFMIGEREAFISRVHPPCSEAPRTA